MEKYKGIQQLIYGLEKYIIQKENFGDETLYARKLLVYIKNRYDLEY